MWAVRRTDWSGDPLAVPPVSIDLNPEEPELGGRWRFVGDTPGEAAMKLLDDQEARQNPIPDSWSIIMSPTLLMEVAVALRSVSKTPRRSASYG